MEGKITGKDLLPVDFNPFEGPEMIRVVPAIEPQLEIWASCMIGGQDANRAYNESVSLLLKGAFNHGAIESALQDLIKRHEALRCSFSADGMQICVYKELPFQIFFEDLSGQNPGQQQSCITAYSKKDAESSFDLLNGPLFRVALFKLAEQEHFLTITAHHIICDGWSLGIMLQDLAKLYSAYVKNETPSLPEAIQLSQYAREQHEFAKSDEYRKIEQYWVDKYKGDVPLLNMPIDFVRPLMRDYKSQRDDYSMSEELIADTRKIGAKAGCSLITTLIAALEVVLYRMTGQNDIVLGLPVAGQSVTGNYSLIGHCVHLLPLRSSPQGDISFIDYLKKRKIQILNDYDHQQFTFGSLLKKLNIARDPSRVPLVPIAFNIDMGLDDGVSFEGLKHKLVYNPRAYENFEIFLNASGSQHSLVFEWSYNTQLFKPSTIKRMMGDFESLLHTIVKDPEIEIKNIPFPTRTENKLAGSPVSYPKDKTIVGLFSAQAEKTPDKIAIVFGEKKISYKELDEKSNQLAHYFIGRGVRAETLVPICMERSIENMIGILGILKAGGAYVPIDPNYPAERIAFMIADCKANAALTSRSCSNKLPEQQGLLVVIFEDHLEKIILESRKAPVGLLDPAQLAYIMYTSGSTGKPKGAMIEHRNVVSLALGGGFVDLSEKDILLSTGSPSFDATTFEYWGMLLNGGRLVLCPEETLFDGRQLKKEITEQNVNIIWFTSSLLNQWVNLDISVFEGLKTILVGGEKLSEKHIEKLRKAYPEIAIINGYGPTENTTFSLTYPISLNEIIGSIPIGKPLSNRSAYVLNQDKQLCPIGVTGELYVGGAGVARGYLNLPALTTEKFMSDSFSTEPKAKMYRTGDLAKELPDGNIEYIGRIDDQVKIRGFRIELGEIESVLHQCPEVKNCAITAKDDKEIGKRLIAYVVPEGLFSKETTISYLQAKLPEYMIPRVFVELDKIPLTSNGKVDRKNLPDPESFNESIAQKNKEGPTDGQKLVAGIFAEALGLDQVGANDDFFELGGHSLIAIKVMKLLEDKTGQRLPVTSLFEAPTAYKLSMLLSLNKKAISWKSLVPIKPSGGKPKLYIVHGSGLTVLVFNSLARGLDPDQPVYGLQAKGLNGEDPLNTIEEIAAYYISEILEQDPNGPYCLAGYSFGGLVAFEMAKRLEAMGKEIRTLAIFDTNANISDNFFSWAIRIKRKTLRQFPKMKFILRSLKRNFKETTLYQFNFFKGKLRGVSEKLGLVSSQQTEEELLSVYAKKINEKHFKAYHNYKLTPYNGVIDLFRVNKRLYYLDDPEFLGWKPYALCGLRVHEIPGDHKTFLLSPNDKELARILQQVLDESTSMNLSGKNPLQGKQILKAV